MTRILLLGGTTEAGELAKLLAAAQMPAIFSYAGRTQTPLAQPLPLRIGGFGGVDGLVAYVQSEQITHMVDATHPFAAQISHNAGAACQRLNLPLMRLERPAWQAEAGDRWHHVADIQAVVDALPERPARVFLAIGKQNLAVFAQKPQHHYLLRLVDPPAMPPLPQCEVIIARGPFDVAGDMELMVAHGITHIVAKNAGGSGAEAKLIAARRLGLPVLMIDRPAAPQGPVLQGPRQVMAWLHQADLGV